MLAEIITSARIEQFWQQKIAGEVTNAELKAVHLQIPSEKWLDFVLGLHRAVHDVAVALDRSSSGSRQKQSYLLELTTNR